MVRSALADAASVASLMTTTECVAWALAVFGGISWGYPRDIMNLYESI